ncbi:MAG: hypothetical protein EOP45_20975 [Sphingobacteriaceae bacterium]|nr:MAG: hypothetical protein EOP45_20975 [Sphingobacteriaceae bacterium]
MTTTKTKMQIIVTLGNVNEAFDQPICLLKHIKSLAPLLDGDVREPITFTAADEEDFKAFVWLFKWLERIATIDELIMNMVQFRTLVQLADKYDVPRLLDDLSAWYNGTMLTLFNIHQYLKYTDWTLNVACGCGKKHIIATTNDHTAYNDMQHAEAVYTTPLHYIETHPHKCRCSNWNPPPFKISLSGTYRLVDQLRGIHNFRPDSDEESDDEEDEDELLFGTESDLETIQPIADYLFAAKYRMTNMMAALRVYTILLLKIRKGCRDRFLHKLVEINGKMANEWILCESSQTSY